MGFRPLNRRTLLSGAASASVALPWLEAMQPAVKAASAPSSSPQRLLCVFQPNGVYPAAWDVTGTGADYQLSRILEPLHPLRSEVTIVSHLDNVTAGNHVRMTSAFLTGAGVENGYCPPSVDQLVAEQIGSETLFPSLQLGTEPPRQGDDGASPVSFANTVSWSTGGRRMSPEINPQVAFDRMFRTGGGSARIQQANLQRSVLDLVRGEARSLRLRISVSDRIRLDDYLHSVRELEVRIGRSLQPSQVPALAQSADLQRPPAGIPRDREQHLQMMMELMVLALQTDTTRVGTLMTAHGFSRQSFSFLAGVSGDHHVLSHHQEQPHAVEQYTRISRWHIEQFAWLLNRMQQIPEADGTLLDNSVVLYGSGMKDGNGHRGENLPILLAGRGGGRLKPGRHIALREHTPLANLHCTLAHTFGLPLSDFNGSSTGEVTEVLT